MCLSLSFIYILQNCFLKSEYLLLFKINQLMVPIGKKPATGDHGSSLKIFLAKLFLARCPCALIFHWIKISNQSKFVNVVEYLHSGRRGI